MSTQTTGFTRTDDGNERVRWLLPPPSLDTPITAAATSMDSP